MKKEVFLAVLVLSFLFFISMVYALDCPNGIVSYWKFENNFDDFIGMNPGQNYGASFASGKINLAASFSTNDYAVVSESASLQITQGTIAFWIKPSSADLTGIHTILDKDCDVPPTFNRAYGAYFSSGKLIFTAAISNTLDSTYSLVSTRTFSADNWYFVALIKNSTGKYMYINNILDSYDTSANSQPDIRQGTMGIIIGRDVCANSGFYNGLLDELAIFNRGLTSQEISIFYNNGAGADYCSLIILSCTDSDGGRYDYGTQGITCDWAGCLTDSCSGNVLTEYYCAGDVKTYDSYNCPFGLPCSDGACSGTVPDCTDSDGGRNYGLKGTTCTNGGANCLMDSCSGNVLTEYYCSGDIRLSDSYNCPFDLPCSDGACTPTCADNQIIMKLNKASNSHAALWNDASYTTKICYDSIFGTAGNGNHACSGANNIVWLNKTTNSHASTSQSTSYNIPVCYGNLVCRNIVGSCDTANGERLVVALNKTTNSHVSTSSDLNYAIKICCKPGGACVPESDSAFCSRLGKECGSVTALDNCGISRTTNCGTCAVGETCNANGICEAGANPANCNDYSSLGQTACEADSYHIAIPTVEEPQGTQPAGFCEIGIDTNGDGCIISCSCAWNSENQVCEGHWAGQGESCEGECNWLSTTLKDCDIEPQIGFRNVSITKVWTGDPSSIYAAECSGTEQIIRKCLSSALLGFFNFYNFAIALLLVVSYFVFKKRFINEK